MKYYLDENDYVYREDLNGNLYEYNYVKKIFQNYNGVMDLEKWHEFDESELDENINLKAYLFDL